jgi:hypothetical protein
VDKDSIFFSPFYVNSEMFYKVSQNVLQWDSIPFRDALLLSSSTLLCNYLMS